jgi:Flp pilus assembly protein TadD
VRRSQWLASVGMLWFFLALVPSSVLAVLDQGEPMAEHRVYLASCGLFLAAGAGIGRLAQWGVVRTNVPWVRRAVGAGLTLVVLAFGAQTLLRNAVWADPVALWQESVDLAPRHDRPRLLLGEVLQDAGRRNEALEQYRTAIRLRPANPMGHVRVGQMLAEVGEWPQARLHFLEAIAIQPGNVPARNALLVIDEIESRFGVDGNRR